MKFLPLTNEDLDEIRYLQPSDWSDIVPDFQFYIGSTFCFPLKIEINDRIVGVGASIVLEGTAWLVQIIVDINYRGQGIGSRMVDSLLRDLENKSIDSYSLIATTSGKPIYVKAGFRDVTEYTFLRRENAWRTAARSANVVLFREEYRSRIYKMDREISGENRTMFIGDLLANSLIYLKDDEITGFYIPDLREGLICAETEEAGLELMKVKYAKVDKANLPSDNITGISFLKGNGFSDTEKKGTRMILGKELNWKPRNIYGRIGGNLG